MAVEGSCIEIGLTAESWLSMWDSGFSHDHGQHVHDETHFTSCGDECEHSQDCHSEHQCHSDHEDHLKVDKHLQRNLHHLTGGGKDKAIFVSLCGDSPDMEWLCSQGYSVVGAEISETAVKGAFEKATGGQIPFEVTVDGNIKVYSAANKRLKIFVGNFFEDGINPSKLGTFDCIWDAHGIVSLPVSQQKTFAEKLGSFLNPGGRILFSTVEYDVTKLTSGPAPAPVPAAVLQEFYPQCKVELLENEPLKAGELEGVDVWTNPVVLVTFK